MPNDFDENTYPVESRIRTGDRKTRQLCAQAERALGSVIQNELLDDNLDGLTVMEVRPFPDAGRVLVVLSAPTGTRPEQAMQALDRVSGRLREALGRAISRKRVPLLSFTVLPDVW